MRIFRLAIGLVLLSSCHALAHSAGWSQAAANATVFTFYYVGTGPMDADVRVFVPGATGDPYLITHTDPRGRVAFIPDRPGTWRAQADDGKGHSVVGSVTVNTAGEVRDPTAGITAVLWLSLAANLVLGIALWRRRRGFGTPKVDATKYP